MAELVRQVVKQTGVRVFKASRRCRASGQLFEPHTEIIRNGKASKPTELGKNSAVRTRQDGE
jgi:IS5 family transposase